MSNLQVTDWKKINQMKRAFDERYAVPVSNFKVEPEGEPGEQVMDNDDWLLARQADFSRLLEKNAVSDQFLPHIHDTAYTVTASECSAATADMECSNPWTSKTELWNLKKGNIPLVKKPANEAALMRGHMVEDYVLYLAEKILVDLYGEGNVFVWQDKRLFASREYPWMFCDTDGHALVMDNGKARFILIEAKTVGARNYKAQQLWSEGHIPEYYERQCRHEMATFHAEACMIVGVWNLEIDGYAYQFIKRDMSSEMELIKKEKAFIDSLINNEEPEDLITPILTSSFYGRLYAKDNGKTVDLPEDTEDILRKIKKIDSQIANAQEIIDKLTAARAVQTNKLVKIFGECQKGQLSVGDGIFSVKVKHGHCRDSFDFKKLEKDHPDIYSSCVKTGAPSFDKKQAKKEGFKDYDDYVIKGKPNGNISWTVDFKPAEENEAGIETA